LASEGLWARNGCTGFVQSVKTFVISTAGADGMWLFEQFFAQFCGNQNIM